MKQRFITTLLQMAVCVALGSNALALTTWYVNGVSGSDSNNCKSAATACKTIGRAISRAVSGDSISVASATYGEHLTVGLSMTILGAGAGTTVIDGGSNGTVVTISSSTAHVTLSGVTLRNGLAQGGGGINNQGTLTLVRSTVSGNRASVNCVLNCAASGGGIVNSGTLTIINSTLSGNSAFAGCRSTSCKAGAFGGGIFNTSSGTLTINNSTLSGNAAAAKSTAIGGGILNQGTLAINNSTLSGNRAPLGGGIFSHGALTLSNSTLSGNYGGGIDNSSSAVAVALQNSIVANNSNGGNCSGISLTSKGHNLSSDSTCNFSNTGDLNNIDPRLGPLQNNGGPTQTMVLPSGSPAIDAGNPSGCTDGQGHLLKTDQRGMPRPNPEDTGGCDMGAYESQSD